VVCLLRQKALSSISRLSFYLLRFDCHWNSAVTASISAAGFTSNAYLYFYFYSDALLTISLYFVLMSLYAKVFSEMGSASLYVEAQCCFSQELLESPTTWSRRPQTS